MKRTIVATICIILFSVNIYAQRQPARVQAISTPIQRVQPDGDTLTILLRGDERSHFTMTLDGWKISENEKGQLCYLTVKKNKETLSSRQAHNADRRKCCEKRWLKKNGIQLKKDD